MTTTGDITTAAGTTTTTEAGQLGLVHLRVGDADQASAFFGSLFGWVTERRPYRGHTWHYAVNTGVTVVLIDDPEMPDVRLCVKVDDMTGMDAALRRAGGQVAEAEIGDDGTGWARATDNQGIGLTVYRSARDYPHADVAAATGSLSFAMLVCERAAAVAFYGQLFGWPFERVHADSYYSDTVPHVGVLDIAVRDWARGQGMDPETVGAGGDQPHVNVYVEVADLDAALAKLTELGGRLVGDPAPMGPYVAAECLDDQGTRFGIVALTDVSST